MNRTPQGARFITRIVTVKNPLARDLIGLFGGGISAAVAAALVFQMFHPLPPNPKPTDHTGEALVLLVLVVFFCGGFIGRRAFSADSWSDLLLSVAASYGVILFLCLTASLDLQETLAMVGFATSGMVVASTLLMFLGRCFPADANACEA